LNPEDDASRFVRKGDSARSGDKAGSEEENKAANLHDAS
jgi:hypothetical protein